MSPIPLFSSFPFLLHPNRVNICGQVKPGVACPGPWIWRLMRGDRCVYWGALILMWPDNWSLWWWWGYLDMPVPCNPFMLGLFRWEVKWVEKSVRKSPDKQFLNLCPLAAFCYETPNTPASRHLAPAVAETSDWHQMSKWMGSLVRHVNVH